MMDAALLLQVTRGWPALAWSYGTVQVPMWAAMARAHAPIDRWKASPVLAPGLMLAVGAAVSWLAPAAHAGSVGAGLCRAIAGAGLSALLGYAGGHVLAVAPAKAEQQVRGAVVREPSARAQPGLDPVRERSRERGGAAMSRVPRLTLAGLPIPVVDEDKHFKLIGATGAGKSTAIRELLTGALARADRAVIADPDGGYLTRFFDSRRGDVILSPFERSGRRWDLFGEITDAYDIDQLALALIPDHPGSDRSWRGYARTLFSAITGQAREAGVSSVGDLYDLLVTADRGELKLLVGGTPAQPFFEEHNDRMLDSVRSVLSSAVGALQYVARQQAAPLSVRRWVQSGEGVLFMPYRAAQIASLRSTISAWMRLAIFETMNGSEGGRALWFVADELDALGAIEGLKDALARLRKFGGRCVLGFQSIAQVSAAYGAGDAQTIVENCGNTLILRCSASEHGGTSRFASQLIGEREVVRTVRSRSRPPGGIFASITDSEQRQVERAVMDSQIERLPDLAGFLKLASTPDWQRVRLRLPARAPAPEAHPAAASRTGMAGRTAVEHPEPAAGARQGHGAEGGARVVPSHEDGWDHV